METIKNFIRTYGAMTLVVMALALVMGILESLRLLNMMSGADQRPSLGDLLTSIFLPWLMWLVAAPIVAFLGQRVRPGTASWGRVALSHMLVGSVMGAAAAVVCMQARPIVFGAGHLPADAFEEVAGHFPPGTLPVELTDSGERELAGQVPEEMVELLGTQVSGVLVPDSGAWWLGPFASGLLTYAALVVVVMAFQLYRDVRERQTEADHLESQLALAQLATLRMQIRPHFLFNTLSSIATLMPRDAEGARRMVNQLADLLRASFSEAKVYETTLQDDVELLRSYLAIQQVRFGEKLEARISIEPDVHEALVPSFCLQPLIENAIIHGVGTRPELGTITIRACREGEDLFIDVSDDGPGAVDDELFEKGVGLRNTRDRLEQLYGDRSKMTIESGAEMGFTVRLRIPYHETPSEATQT